MKLAIYTFKNTHTNLFIITRHFCLQGSKGRCHGNQIMAEIGKTITKWPQLQLWATHPCRVWFWDRICAIGECICDTLLHHGLHKPMAKSMGLGKFWPHRSETA